MAYEKRELTEEQFAKAYEAGHPFSPWESISEEARAFYRKRYAERAPYLQYQSAQQPMLELMKALEEMINERYSELDMMSCEYPQGSSEAIAWESGVRQAWKLWDLSKQPGIAALAKFRATADPTHESVRTTLEATGLVQGIFLHRPEIDAAIEKIIKAVRG